MYTHKIREMSSPFWHSSEHRRVPYLLWVSRRTLITTDVVICVAIVSEGALGWSECLVIMYVHARSTFDSQSFVIQVHLREPFSGFDSVEVGLVLRFVYSRCGWTCTNMPGTASRNSLDLRTAFFSAQFRAWTTANDPNTLIEVN